MSEHETKVKSTTKNPATHPAHAKPLPKNGHEPNQPLNQPLRGDMKNLSHGQMLHLQRTIGNRAVQRLLKGQPQQAGKPIKITSTARRAIQRAIGFEFEFGEWRTTHNDEGKSILDKGEEIIKGDGYKIEGEKSGSASAIEVVTMPFTKVGEAKTSITQARKTLKSISNKGDGIEHPARRWKGKKNVLITPKGAKGKMQASPAIALDKLPALYGKQAERGGGGKGLGDSVSKHLNDKAIKKKYLGKNDPSKDLIGLVTLLVDYLEQGSGKGTLSYPKSAFKLMARTSFNKMFELVPEHEFFKKPENQQKWVNLVLEVSARIFGKELYDEVTQREIEVEKDVQKPKKVLGFKSVFGIKFGTKTAKVKVKEWIDWRERKERQKSVKEMGKEPVLGQVFNDVAPLPEDDQGEVKPEYKLEITRKDWLKEMFNGDLLSKANDKRFEGMGAYGNSTDLQVVEEQAEKATVLAVEETGLKDKVEMGLDDVSDSESESDTDTEPKLKEAPIFELRGLRDMFGIDQDVSLDNWESKVEELFTIVDEVNEGSFKPGGKPNIPDDTTNEDIWKKK